MKKQIVIVGIAIQILTVGMCGCLEEGIKTTDMSVEEIKNSAINVSYDDLMRNIENYKGKTVCFRGGVVQVQEESGNAYNLRVATAGSYLYDYYKNIIYVNYKGPRFLEDDIIDVWGYVKGLKTYSAVLGNEITIPELDAFHLELVDE